jgi:hypothetical protein
VFEINPDAREVCGGGDENCNGWVDDEDPDLDAEGTGTLWYFDGDGDGFGDMELMWSCEPLFDRLVEVGGDCSDDDPDSFPGALELCDGSDNSCSGTEDDVLDDDMPVWFADSDGDGFGDPDVEARSCTAPAAFVENFDDCDDDNRLVNPDATEDAGNLVDEDCQDGAAPFTDLLASEGDGTLNELDSPYRVSGDYVVEEGVTLTVPECIEFLFETDASLIVRGELIIDGSSECPVIMRPTDPTAGPGSWSGVHFTENAVGARYGLLNEWLAGSLLRNIEIYGAGSRGSIISSDRGIPAVDGVLITSSAGTGVNYTIPPDDLALITIRRFEADSLDEAIRIDAFASTVVLESLEIVDCNNITSISAQSISLIESRFYDNEGGLRLRTTAGMKYDDNELWSDLSLALLIESSAPASTMNRNLFVGGDPAVSFTGGGSLARVFYTNNIIAGAHTGLLIDDSVFSVNARASQFLHSSTAVHVENSDVSSSSLSGANNLIQGSTGTEAMLFGNGSASRLLFGSSWAESAFYQIDGNFVYSGYWAPLVLSMTRNWWEGLTQDEVELRIYDVTNDSSLATVSVDGNYLTYPPTVPVPAPIVTTVRLLDTGVQASWEPSVDDSVTGYRVWLTTEPRWHRSLDELIDGSGVYTTETTATFDLEDTTGTYFFYVNAIRDEDEASVEQQLQGQLQGAHSWFTPPVLATRL